MLLLDLTGAVEAHKKDKEEADSSKASFEHTINVMVNDEPPSWSERGWSNVANIMPKINAAMEERTRQNNTNIDLSTAENWLIRPELIDLCKDAISTRLEARVTNFSLHCVCQHIELIRGLQHLSYPNALGGDADVLQAFARFFNTYFNPHIPVEPSHLTTAPGAASCLDALLYNICDPGDGVLVPGPYWSALPVSSN